LNIQDRVTAAAARLSAAGIARDEAERDARLLARWVLGWDAARLIAQGRDPQPPELAASYDAIIERRARREPVAYLVGHQEFWGLDFDVSPAVLIPRPETELIVEAVIERFAKSAAPLRLADVGTGSGCLAVALARELPRALIVATDTSHEAIAIARRNAAQHGVSERIDLRRTDLLDGIEGPFDLIVSNPPYVPDIDRPTLSPEVRDHEPAAALFAGPDGRTIIERLLKQAHDRLRDGGTLVMEFGHGQSAAIQALVNQTGRFAGVSVRQDLQGIPRVLIASRE
jgi:release factor glutamine methyltransferase